MKSIPHLKISEDDLFDIEKKLNTVYELNKNDFLEKDKEIKEFKKIYQINDNFMNFISIFYFIKYHFFFL